MGRVVLIADHDDRCARLLYNRLRQLDVATIYFQLALSDEHYDVDLDDAGFTIRSEDVVLRESDFDDVALVVYRRGRMQDTPAVVSTLDTPHDRAFAEREWQDLLESALHRAQTRASDVPWLNGVAVTAASRNKLVLLDAARSHSLRVPPLRISTHSRAPSDLGSGYVAKAINRDEHITDELSYRTSALDPATLEAIRGVRTSCPSLIQSRVAINYELRVYHCLGEFVTIRIQGSDYEDVRLEEPDLLAVTEATLPGPLAVRLQELCAALSLQYCTFDFLAAGDELWLTDVTPNGSWSSFEELHGVPLTSRLADIVASHVRRPT